jgi:hypothetical protein
VLHVFEEQLAIIGLGERIGRDALDAAAIHAGLGEEQVVDAGEIGHRAAPAEKNRSDPSNMVPPRRDVSPLR